MDLLLEIARCPLVAHCLNGATDHPCATIVHSQGVASPDEFQSPEPWSGHLAAAPLLFLSSNPSIRPNGPHQYPRASWDDASIHAYFESRFGGSPLSSVTNGIYDHLPGGERSRKWTQYWASVRGRAAELLEKPRHEVVPGRDYALTEVVRCKSREEIGVESALTTCADQYLEPTLHHAAALIIVVMGAPAERVMRERYQLGWTQRLYGPLTLAQRERYVVFLPHPSGWAGAKTFAATLEPAELQRLQQWLRGSAHPAVKGW